ncbi:MAG TPA: amidase family protein, partial [Nevskiaceae bacterium]|nr:amidase family protein [Nevskiaceae bacterium]
GSGVAAAASLATLTVGTETDGSIVCPASVNGVVGLKPTVGLVSRSGIIPIAASQDTAGPITRTVAEAALLLGVLAGADVDDPATQEREPGEPPDYLAALSLDGLKGARIGVARNLGGFHEQVDAVFEQALSALREAGATLVDPADIKLAASAEAREATVLSYEFKDGINHYLAHRDAGPRDLADLIAYNKEHAQTELAWFGQELFLQAQQRGPLTDAAYRHAQHHARHAARKAIDDALAQHQVDVIVAPTMGAAWTTDLINGDHIIGGSASAAAAIAGYPHLTVPMGYVHELPVGLSFIGTAWSEPLLLKLGYAYEQRAQVRRPPQYAAQPALAAVRQ